MNKVREGYKITEIGDIPIEWEVRYLEDVCEILDSYRKPIKASDREEMKGDIPYYGASGVIDWINDFIFDEELILLGEDGENLNSRNTDLAFKISGKSWVNNHAHVFRIANKNRDNIDFMVYYLESKDYSRYIAGSAQPKITQAQCRKFLLPSPDLKEQEKIASILSTVDEQIDNVDALIEKNKELKKGLMQTLLTKGIGHTKFKKTEIGEIPEEWEVSNLTNIVDIKGRVGWKGYTKKDLVEFGPLAIGAMHINSNNKLDLSEPVYLSKKKYEESPEIMVSKDDIILAQRGSLGKVVLIEKEIGEATINPSMVLIKNIKINSRYLYYFLCSEYIQKVIFKETSQTSIPMISQEQIGKFKIIIPTIKEQEKIASILSEVDKKIEEYENKKQKLEKLKKGLMQQLLTGMIRVTV